MPRYPFRLLLFLSLRCKPLLFGCLALGFFGSCSYIERFVIRVEESAGFPCMGVNQMEFTVEKLVEQQDEIVQAKFSEGFLPNELFWDSNTGKCQIIPIPLKQIPYGGKRKLTIVAYDSSGRFAVSTGSTPEFVVESSGDNVQSAVTLSLQRRANIGTGTLILRFNNPLPDTTSRLQVVLKEQGDDKEESLFVATTDKKPEFIILTNIPFADERPLFVRALDSAQALVGLSDDLTYTISNNSPLQMSARLAVTFNPPPP